MPGRGKTGPRGQRGVALVLVLWFVAAMSVLVAAIVAQARGDIRLAQHHVSKAQATAAGDGAVRLFLAEREGLKRRGGELPWQGRYRVGDLSVAVLAVPTGLLVDANRADAALLRQVLVGVRALPPEDARVVADAIVQWRPPRSGAGSADRFSTLEDLLQVDGFNRAAWSRVRDYLTVRRGMTSAATAGRPASLLALLETASPRARSRQADLRAALPADAPRVGGSSLLRIDALLRLGGRTWLRRCWVDGAARGADLPWSTLRREPARIVSDDMSGDGGA